MQEKEIKNKIIKISNHAIDRATTRHLNDFLAMRKNESVGAYEWLRTRVKHFIDSGMLKNGKNDITDNGIRWPIIVDKDSITLKTVSPKSERKNRKKPLSKNQCIKMIKRNNKRKSRN